MRSAILSTAALVLIATAAGPLAAEEGGASQTQARKISDRVIANLNSWKTNSAASILEKNQAKLGDSPEYKTAFGLLRAEQGEYGEAVALLKEAARGDTADPAPEYYRGEVLYWQKKYGDADKAWQEALARAKTLVTADPDDARAQYYYGASLNRQKQTAAALEALGKALDGGFKPAAMVHFQIGFAHLFDKKWQQAKEAFDKAATADERFAPLYYYRGLAWDQLGRKDNMLIDMDEFVRLAPNAPEADKAKALLQASGR
jgi:tetratricopeptide (TPR) repeat protein